MKGKLFRQSVVLASVLGLAALAMAQRGPSRRRADLTPIVLDGGGRVEFTSFQSDSMNEDRPYSIFYPPSYRQKNTRYPVIYFLHGLNNDHTSWTMARYGNLHERIEKMMLDKQIPQFVLVCPKADNSFYTNQINGGKRYEDLITHDLIQHIEVTCRVYRNRKNRAISGTSMGGYGALKAAFKHPELYAAAAGHSPIVFLGKNPLDVPEEMKHSRMYQYFRRMLGPIFGEPINQSYWDENNLLNLAKTNNLKGLRILFDYGTADRYNRTIHLDKGLKALDGALTKSKVNHIFRVYPNEPHGWALVGNHIRESLSFLSQTFDSP